MANRSSASHDISQDHDMHDVGYLRARADYLRTAASTSRDPEIARALREVAGDFDTEARHEATRQFAGQADEQCR
jgi:hypothetical protein